MDSYVALAFATESWEQSSGLNNLWYTDTTNRYSGIS